MSDPAPPGAVPAAATSTPADPSTAPAEQGPEMRLAQSRKWAWRAFATFGVSQIVVAAALVPAFLDGLRGAPGARLGETVLAAVLHIAFLLLLAGLGARTVQLGRALSQPRAVPAPARAALRAAQAAAALVAVLGLVHLFSGQPGLGLAHLAVAALALLAAGAWTSRGPGAAARGSLLAAVAGLLWLIVALPASGPQLGAGSVLHTAVQVALPPGAAVFVATLALVAFAVLRRSPTRSLAYAGAALAGGLGALQVLVLGLDLLGSRPWLALPPGATAAGVSAFVALAGVAVAAVAAVLGLAAAGYALAHYGPPLSARMGAGFLAPESGSACTRCGLVPSMPARFCPDCGEAMARPSG